jgi:hypothetical protein
MPSAFARRFSWDGSVGRFVIWSIAYSVHRANIRVSAGVFPDQQGTQGGRDERLHRLICATKAFSDTANSFIGIDDGKRVTRAR